jgi:hypothetical protein
MRQSRKALTRPCVSCKTRWRTQAVSVSPVTRTAAPAPADQGLRPSPGRLDVNALGSLCKGINNGRSKPRATFRRLSRSLASLSTKSSIHVPPVGSVWTNCSPRAQANRPCLIDPISAQKTTSPSGMLHPVFPSGDRRCG